MYSVAMRYLSIPDSNGDQERTFSCGTWMDGRLKGRQNDATFEHKVLIKKNSDFIDQHRDQVQADYKKSTEKRTKDCDSDDEDLMEAYGIDCVDDSD